MDTRGSWPITTGYSTGEPSPLITHTVRQTKEHTKPGPAPAPTPRCSLPSLASHPALQSETEQLSIFFHNLSPQYCEIPTTLR